MKRLKKIQTCLALALLLTGLCGHAQGTTSDSALQKIFDSDVLLPLLIDSAIKNSPQIHKANNNIKVYEEDIAATKKSLLSGISFFSNYAYGTATDLSQGKDFSTTTNQFSNFRTSTGDRYQLGVNVQIPLTGFLLRKSNVRTAELHVRIAEDEREDDIQMIKREVIRLYQETKLGHRLLMTSSSIKQGAYANFTLAQKDFLKVNNDLEQYSRIQEMFLKASMEYDLNVNRFQTAYLTLQAYTGVQLSQLIKRVR